MIIAAIVLTATPTITFEEMESKMHDAYRSLTDCREVLSINISTDGQSQLLRLERLISGQRNRLRLSVDGAEVSDTGFDGLTAHAVLHPERIYQLRQSKNDAFEEKYKPTDLSKEDDGYFNFVPQHVYGVRIEVKPAPKVVSEDTIEVGGKVHKRIVAESPKIGDSDHLRIIYVFHPEKWILWSFEVDAKSRSGKKLGIKATTIESNFAAGLTHSNFAFDVRTVPGYRRIGS